MICSICYEEVNDIFITKCNHSFCKACLNKWLMQKNSCPLCRKILTMTAKEFRWKSALRMIVPFLNHAIQNESFFLDAHVLYSKFFCFFNHYMLRIVGFDKDQLVHFYHARYKCNEHELFFVETSFLFDEQTPILIFQVFVQLILQCDNPCDLYTCFIECLHFFNLKRGYTNQQLESFDAFKNNLHCTLLEPIQDSF